MGKVVGLTKTMVQERKKKAAEAAKKNKVAAQNGSNQNPEGQKAPEGQEPGQAAGTEQ